MSKEKKEECAINAIVYTNRDKEMTIVVSSTDKDYIHEHSEKGIKGKKSELLNDNFLKSGDGLIKVDDGDYETLSENRKNRKTNRALAMAGANKEQETTDRD